MANGGWLLVKIKRERKKKMTVKGYAKFLLIMAGLGGLLYGVDVGVIAAALPYIERTSTFTQTQIVDRRHGALGVAAVLAGRRSAGEWSVARNDLASAAVFISIPYLRRASSRAKLWMMSLAAACRARRPASSA